MSDKHGERTFKVLQVGCGGISNAWLPHVVAHPSLDLVGLVDLNRDAAVKRAEQHGVPEDRLFTDLADAIRATGAEVVFDTTVPAAHHIVTTTALSRGCHVLGEKPMSDRLDRAQQMVAAASESGKLYAVTQTRRPSNFARRTVAMIEAGTIGDVQEVHCDFYIGAGFGRDDRANDFRKTMPHVLLADMAIHTFDTARQLCGADPVSVYCYDWNPARSWYDVNASAVAVFEMRLPNGDPLVYTYRGSWTNEGMQTNWNADWRIVGRLGTLHTDGGEVVEAETIDPADTGFIRETTHHVADPAPDLPQGHVAMINDFVEALLSDGERQPMCPAEDNIKSLAMVLSAIDSAEKGEKVAVGW